MGAAILCFADISVDSQNSVMCRGERTVFLAPAELRIMLCLVREAGSVVQHSALERAGWGSCGASLNTLEVTLHRLRRKMAALETATRIANVRGVGFTLRAGPATSLQS